jgi:hypothetical protein
VHLGIERLQNRVQLACVWAMTHSVPAFGQAARGKEIQSNTVFGKENIIGRNIRELMNTRRELIWLSLQGSGHPNP